jgi:hypothetical protein
VTYENLYYLLFNAITDAIEAERRLDFAGTLEILIEAQRRAETALMEQPPAGDG